MFEPIIARFMYMIVRSVSESAECCATNEFNLISLKKNKNNCEYFLNNSVAYLYLSLIN